MVINQKPSRRPYMIILSLPKVLYKFYAYARTQECLDAYRLTYEDAVNTYQLLKDAGNDLQTCHVLSGISRATFYRYKKILNDLKHGITPPSKRPKNVRKREWGEADIQQVLKIRKENPTYGKSKITTIFRRDHAVSLSESTVGRILTHIKQKGLLTKSKTAFRYKKKRLFKGHAQRAEFKAYDQMVMGERVQIDHMSVRKNGITVKHFQAWERKSKYIHAGVYSNANASSAQRFLLDFIDKAPFKVLSIQVDGGSEFMNEFEKTCADLKIPLYVLPPRRPDYNGGVERGNKTFRLEFYENPNVLEDSVRGIQAELTKAVLKYNTYRPHASLDHLTPMQYIEKNQL